MLGQGRTSGRGAVRPYGNQDRVDQPYGRDRLQANRGDQLCAPEAGETILRRH